MPNVISTLRHAYALTEAAYKELTRKDVGHPFGRAKKEMSLQDLGAAKQCIAATIRRLDQPAPSDQDLWGV